MSVSFYVDIVEKDRSKKLRTKERINLTSTMIIGLILLVFIEEKQVTESFNKVKKYVLSKSQEYGYKKLSQLL